MKIGILLALLCALSFGARGAELLSIKFAQQDDNSLVELTFDTDDVKVDKLTNKEDKQVILDLKETKATKKVLRAFDTSEFTGALVFVKAYPKVETPGDLRIALQLRDNVRSVIKRQGNKITLSLENRFGAFTQQKVEEGATYKEKINQDDVGKVLVPKSDSVEDILENLTFAGRKKYIGRKISFNVKDVPVEDVLKMIADASGFNIIISDEVKKLAPLTLKLTNIAWDQCLDTIMGLKKLIAQKNGNILIVNTLNEQTNEKKLEIDAKQVFKKQEVLVTKIFPISFGELAEFDTILKPYLTEGRGSISQDKRTNSLIVKDTSLVIDRIRKIIEVLDTQTPQVLIESKIVEVSEEYSRKFGLSNGVKFGYDPIGSITTGPTEVGAPVALGNRGGPGFSFSSADSSLAVPFMGLNVLRFGRLKDLSMNLLLMESESKAKIISSPKVITQNKKKVTITTTDTTSFAVVNGTGDNKTQTYQETEASMKLDVTPQVTNEGSIQLDVSLKKVQFNGRPSDLPTGPPQKAGREVQTNVLVENGKTIVIGGIYSFEKRASEVGVPFLKDIPLLGWFFRTPDDTNQKKTEMIIFLTPRIINQEEAGLKGKNDTEDSTQL